MESWFPFLAIMDTVAINIEDCLCDVLMADVDASRSTPHGLS